MRNSPLYSTRVALNLNPIPLMKAEIQNFLIYLHGEQRIFLTCEWALMVKFTFYYAFIINAYCIPRVIAFAVISNDFKDAVGDNINLSIFLVFL